MYENEIRAQIHTPITISFGCGNHFLLRRLNGTHANDYWFIIICFQSPQMITIQKKMISLCLEIVETVKWAFFSLLECTNTDKWKIYRIVLTMQTIRIMNSFLINHHEFKKTEPNSNFKNVHRNNNNNKNKNRKQ